MLSKVLPSFDTYLLGSSRPENVINNFFEGNERFDYYLIKKDLDFAYKNGKHARVHTLLKIYMS